MHKLLHLCNIKGYSIMRLLLLFVFSFITCSACAQIIGVTEGEPNDSIAVAYPKYREDQFYASVSYALMLGKPGGYSQNSFSTGLTVGFLRDMPVNKDRTYAIAAGLGYGYYNIKHNLKVTEISRSRLYEIEPTSNFDKNKQVLHYVELPVELRWRNSNAVSHKFWRIYTGFKMSYLFADKAQFYPAEGGSTKVKGNDDLNSLQYGVYVAAGWNTWNFYAYYGLSSLYKDEAKINTTANIDITMVNFGLMFYIL